MELSTTLSESFFRTFCPNPEVMYDLGELYSTYNNEFFYGKLPELKKIVKKTRSGEEHVSFDRVKWDGRMGLRTLGTYTTKRSTKAGCGIIRLSRKIAKDLALTKSTLLHEMLHAYLDLVGEDRGMKGHGDSFIRESVRINTHCKDKGYSFRVLFYDKEIECQKPYIHSDTVNGNIDCFEDLDFALIAKKIAETVFYNSNTLVY